MTSERFISFDDMDTSTGHVSVTSVENRFPFSDLKELYDYLDEQNIRLSEYKYGKGTNRRVFWLSPDDDDEGFGFELQIIPEETECMYWDDPEETLDTIESWVDDLLSDPDRQLEWLEDDIRHSPYTPEEYKEEKIIKPAKYMKTIMDKIRNYTEGMTNILDIDWNRSINESTQNIIVFNDDEDVSIGYIPVAGSGNQKVFNSPGEFVYEYLDSVLEETGGIEGIFDRELEDYGDGYYKPGKEYNIGFYENINDNVYFEHYDEDTIFERFVDSFRVAVDDYYKHLFDGSDNESVDAMNLLRNIAANIKAKNGTIVVNTDFPISPKKLDESVGMKLVTFDDEDTSTGHVDIGSYEVEVPSLTDVLDEFAEDFKNYGVNVSDSKRLFAYYTIYFVNWDRAVITFFCDNTDEPFEFMSSVKEFIDMDSVEAQEKMIRDYRAYLSIDEVEQMQDTVRFVYEDILREHPMLRRLNESTQNVRLFTFDDEDSSTGYVSVGSGKVSRPVNGVRFLCWLKENTTETNRPVEDMFEIGENLDVELFELDEYEEDPGDFDFGEEDPDFDKTYTKEVERNQWFGDGGMEVICREHFWPKFYNADVQEILINLPIANETSFDDFMKWVKNFDPEKECENYMNKQGWEENPDSHQYTLDYMVEEWERENGGEIPEDVYDDLSDKAWQRVYDDFDDEVRKPCLDAFEGIKQCGEALVKEYIAYCQGLEPNKRRGLENEE